MTDITLLDGGLGQMLVRRAGTPPTPLWAGQVMADRPELLVEIHKEFFAAGATLASTNTYVLQRNRLAQAGMEDRFEALYATAMAAALAARDAVAPRGRIAGCIGPIGASYRPELHPPHAEAVALYAEIAQKLAKGGADLILAETVASVAHARAALEGAQAVGLPVWLALTVDDADGRRLRSGEALADVLPLARDGAAAVLVNCSVPEVMPAALEVLGRSPLPFGAYANGFTEIDKGFLQDASTVDALRARSDLGPEAYAADTMAWVEQGATIVGGCCETTTAHIAEVARALRTAGHRIV